MPKEAVSRTMNDKPEITEEMLKDVGREASLDQLALVLFHECRHQPESGKGIARISEELVKQYRLGLLEGGERIAYAVRLASMESTEDGWGRDVSFCNCKILVNKALTEMRGKEPICSNCGDRLIADEQVMCTKCSNEE